MVKTTHWSSGESPSVQLDRICGLAAEPGGVHVVFEAASDAPVLGWREIEPWIRCRAVTTAEVRSSLSGPALDIALCSDLVYLHSGVELRLPPGEPSAGVLWALGRAGRSALARGLLDVDPITAAEAVRLGLAQRVLDPGSSIPPMEGASLVALTTARDLMRAATGARSAIELASFRLLFAAGDPTEGAAAFLDRRRPDFDHPIE